MNDFQLKVFACITMLIDHIGAYLFPQVVILRIIGRLTFPIFARTIARGYKHTGNLKKYAIRLLVFALISQIPYQMTLKDGLNIFFTLFIGLITIYIYDKVKSKKLGIVILLVCSVLAELIHAIYGVYGVITIFLFYIFYSDYKKLVLWQVGFNIVPVLLYWLMTLLLHKTFDTGFLLQPISVLALIIIYYYNNEQGRKMKYVFYAFYPVHLLILYGVKLLFKI